MDLVGFRVYYRKWDSANLRIMIPGAVVGIAIGTLTFGMLSDDAIRILIGGIAVAFTLNGWLGLGARLQNRINTIWFYRISQACLLATGLQLIYQGSA